MIRISTGEGQKNQDSKGKPPPTKPQKGRLDLSHSELDALLEFLPGPEAPTPAPKPPVPARKEASFEALDDLLAGLELPEGLAAPSTGEGPAAQAAAPCLPAPRTAPKPPAPPPAKPPAVAAQAKPATSLPALPAVPPPPAAAPAPPPAGPPVPSGQLAASEEVGIPSETIEDLLKVFEVPELEPPPPTGAGPAAQAALPPLPTPRPAPKPPVPPPAKPPAVTAQEKPAAPPPGKAPAASTKFPELGAASLQPPAVPPRAQAPGAPAQEEISFETLDDLLETQPPSLPKPAPPPKPSPPRAALPLGKPPAPLAPASPAAIPPSAPRGVPPAEALAAPTPARRPEAPPAAPPLVMAPPAKEAVSAPGPPVAKAGPALPAGGARSEPPAPPPAVSPPDEPVPEAAPTVPAPPLTAEPLPSLGASPAGAVPATPWWETPERFLEEARTRLEGFFAEARAGMVESVGPLEEVCRHMVRLLAEGDHLHARALDFRKSRNDHISHMINVAIFAVKIANGMGLKQEILSRVALGGYVHDVGMIRFPPDRVDNFQSLSPREVEALKRHPEEGYGILRALGPEYAWLADVAHQEHEREDGSGYPRGLRGGQIAEIAKIVGLADIYESLTHPRPYKNRMVPMTLPHEAVKEILHTERQRFGDRYLKGLIVGLSAFPVGTVVRLNNKSVGRVVATGRSLPLRPTVEIFRLGTGEEVTPPRVTNLAQHPLLYIAEASPAGD